MSHQGQGKNPKEDHRIKYNLNPKKVSAAMKFAGVDEYTDLDPGSEHGPAKDIANKLGMDGHDVNVRRGIDRFITRERVFPEK